MKIVLATPLYPPDTEDVALYVKELARRLAKKHTVTVITYGRLLEKIPNVTIIAINKRRPLLLRLIAYTVALRRAAKSADIVYVQNGPATELPTLLVARITNTPIIMHIGDAQAHKRAGERFYLHNIERLAFSQAKIIIADSPPKRPEIIPFEPVPTEAERAWNISWDSHVHSLEKHFLNV